MVIVGIVAGGIGSRMGQNIRPKQFLELSGKPIVIHTIEKFFICPEVDAIVVGVHPDWTYLMDDFLQRYFQGNDRIVLCPGGETRNETILHIAKTAREVYGADDGTILITHDAVRPFLSLRIIEDNIRGAEEFGACDTVFAASDTIVRSDDGKIITDVPIRSQMYQGQTPQSFRLGLFEEIYHQSTPEELQIVTDACKLFWLHGQKVQLVKGEVTNFKITYPFDLKMARTLMNDSENPSEMEKIS